MMLDLSRRGKDVRSLLSGLEDWIMASLLQFGIVGLRRDDLPAYGLILAMGKADSIKLLPLVSASVGGLPGTASPLT